MKKLKVIIPLILILMAIFATPVLASDITDAKWTGDIKVTNAGTAASGVATVFNLDEDILISGNYILNDLSNLAIRDPSGADAAYMPGWDANPWCLHVPSIGAGGIQNYRFYAGGSTPMGGKMAYFPGDAGLTINDAAALELGSNFEIELSGCFPTGMTSPAYHINKSSAFACLSIGNCVGVVLRPNINTTANDMLDIYDNNWNAQTFTPNSTGSVSTLYVPLLKTGSPTGDVYFEIRATDGSGHPTGAALTSGTIVASTLTTSMAWYSISLTPYTLTGGTKYAIVCWANASGTTSSNYIEWPVGRGSTGNYLGGNQETTSDAGSSWSTSTRDNTFALGDQAGGFSGSTSSGGPELFVSVEVNHIMKITADGTDLKIYIDGVERGSVPLNARTVPDNINDIVCFASSSMPYVNYLKITVNGTLQQHLVYQYAATPVTDISGQNNQPASVSIRTTSSDADVTGTFANLRPMAAAVATYTPGGASELITTPPEMPDNMYDEDYDNIPGAAVVNTLLDAGNIPRTFFWFPAIILLAIAVGFGVCVLTRSLMGMALSMTAVIVIFSFMGPIPFWVIIPFGLFALAIIIKRENPGGF